MTNFYRLGDSVDAGDWFCGGGGASQGVIAAGVDLRLAVNHDAVAIATHAANHPTVDHHQVDLLEYDIGRFPAVRMAHFSPSCKHHSQANANKVYEQPAALREFVAGKGGEEVARSGYAASERSRVTMSCVLRYAAKRQPETMVVENVVEAAKWGPGRDGSTFQWWLGQLDILGYETRPVFANSVAFGVPQSRDRMFVVCWRKGMRRPNLDHWIDGWCHTCERIVPAFQWFRQPTKAWPMSEWGKLGKQYDYVCDLCTSPVDILHTPVASVLDFTDLGPRIADRADHGLRPLAESTMGRIHRYLEMHDHRLPAITITASKNHAGRGWPVDGPMGSVTTRHEQALISAAQVTVYGNTHEREGSTCRGRSIMEPAWTQHTTEAYGVAFHGGVYEYQNGVIADPTGPIGTLTGHETMALAGATIPMRQHTLPTSLDRATHTMTSDQVPALATLGAMFAKNNGQAHDTKYHATSDPLNSVTASRENTSLVTGSTEPVIDVDDIRFRMLQVDEIRGIMAYAPDFKFANPDGSDPTKRDKVRLLGDGVTPPVLEWLTNQTLAIMS